MTLKDTLRQKVIIENRRAREEAKGKGVRGKELKQRRVCKEGKGQP